MNKINMLFIVTLLISNTALASLSVKCTEFRDSGGIIILNSTSIGQKIIGAAIKTIDGYLAIRYYDADRSISLESEMSKKIIERGFKQCGTSTAHGSYINCETNTNSPLCVCQNCGEWFTWLCEAGNGEATQIENGKYCSYPKGTTL